MGIVEDSLKSANWVNSPVGHIPGPVAILRHGVKHLAVFAAISARNVSVDAHVEELAVVGIRVARVGHGNGLVDLLAAELENI